MIEICLICTIFSQFFQQHVWALIINSDANLFIYWWENMMISIMITVNHDYAIIKKCLPQICFYNHNMITCQFLY